MMRSKRPINRYDMPKKQGSNPSLTLRVPARLQEMLRQAAAEKEHSVNAEANARLWRSFEDSSPLADRMDALEKKHAALEAELAALKAAIFSRTR